MVMKQVCTASSQMRCHSGSRLARRGPFTVEGGKLGEFIPLQVSVHEFVVGFCPFSNNRHGIPLPQRIQAHPPLA